MTLLLKQSWTKKLYKFSGFAIEYFDKAIILFAFFLDIYPKFLLPFKFILSPIIAILQPIEFNFFIILNI